MYYKNVFYFYYLNSIGGVETMFYQIAKKYKDYDITIFYSYGDEKQIERLKKYVRVLKWNEQTIKCDKVFFNYNITPISHIIANKYYEIIHADYEKMGIQPNIHPKITEYIGVSQAVCDSFTKLTGLPCTLCYNPLIVDEPKRVLNLISATRLTKEKGKDRMIQFAAILDKANIPYLWTIFTDDKKEIKNPNIIYMKPRLDISSYIAKADYTVQLSDTEAYCYTMMESLCLGTPIIVTKWLCLKELGIDERYGFILPFDMKDIPIKDIYEKRFNFNFTPKKDIWDSLLSKSKNKPTYQQDKEFLYLVMATDAYQKYNCKDSLLGKIPQPGEQWWIPYERLETLLYNNKFNEEFIKIKAKRRKNED